LSVAKKNVAVGRIPQGARAEGRDAFHPQVPNGLLKTFKSRERAVHGNAAKPSGLKNPLPEAHGQPFAM
jgi:hypothetical protein